MACSFAFPEARCQHVCGLELVKTEQSTFSIGCFRGNHLLEGMFAWNWSLTGHC